MNEKELTRIEGKVDEVAANMERLIQLFIQFTQTIKVTDEAFTGHLLKLTKEMGKIAKHSILAHPQSKN